MMKKIELNIDWDLFKTKFNGRETSKFEQMAYLLFASETGNPNGIFRYKNHPGIETEPVDFNGKSSGFQAKFLTSFSDGKNDIIDSLTKAKVNHPGLEDIYIYTNNEPGMAYKNTGEKPGYMTDIEKKASVLGLNVVWRLPSHIEAQLALPQNRYIYDIFFGDENSNYALSLSIDNHSDSLLALIREDIEFHGECIHIDRKTIASELVDQFTPGTVLMVSGEGGSGKTALIKEIYHKHSKEFPIVIFRASELNRDSLNDIFKLDRDFSFPQFLETYSSEPKRVFVVDSAERLAEFDDLDLIAGMFHTLLKENWTLLFLTRTVYQNALSTFMADGFDINPSLINIPTLQESELQQLALSKGFSLPDNPRFVSRLSNLFYFGEYLKYYDDIDRKGNYRNFTDKLWLKKICGPLRKDGMDAQRARCMIEIAKRRADSGCFYIDTEDLQQNVLFALCQDEILGFDASRNEYFISHDIYEEWALNKIVNRSWRKIGEVQAFFSAIGDSLPIRRAFRMWLSDELMESDGDIPQIIHYAFKDSTFPIFWKDEIIVACLLSNHADRFFSLFDKEFKANNFAIFRRALFLLRIACVVPNKLFQQLMVPCDKGWEDAIHFMYRYRNETFDKDIAIALPVLRAWTSANPSGQATKEVGVMVFSVIENADVSGAHCFTNLAKDLINISLKSVKEIPQQITAFINKIIATSNTQRSYVMRLFVEEILTNPITHLIVFQELPLEVIALCEKCWTYEPPESNELTNHDMPFVSDYLSRENKLGLSNETELHYFPPSAYQTPILFLLRKKPIETIDFIIRFINKFVENYKACDYDTCVEEATLKIEGEEYHQFSSPGLWECYRGMGTPVLPYLIQSVHMALEKFLMEIFNSFEVDKVKWILKKILLESKSASLTAVVTSVVLKHYMKLPDIAIMIFSTPEFIDLDLSRAARENEAKSLARMSAGLPKPYNELCVKERLEACNDKHRSTTLENIVHAYQYCRIPGFSDEEQQEYIGKIHNLIDSFKSDENIMMRMSAVLERIDRRNLKMEAEPVDGGIMLKFIPQKHSEQTIEGQKEAERQYKQIMKYSILSLWSSKYINENNGKIPKITEYDNSPEKVMTDLRLLMADTESLTGRTSLINKGTPEAVASKLLRESADKLSGEDRLYCKEIVLTGCQNVFSDDYWYQVGDGTEDSIMALPTLMELYPEEADDYAVILALTMVRFPKRGDWSSISKFAPAAVRNSHIWKKNPEKAESILAYFLTMQKLAYTEKDNFLEAFENVGPMKTTIDVKDIDCTQVPDLNTILALLPYDTDDSRFLVIYEKICTELPGRFFNDYRRSSDPEDNPYSETAFIEARFNVFDNISRFILSRSNADEIERFLNQLIRKFACSDHTAYFINSLICKEDEMQRIQQFEAVWEMLYPKILEFKDKPNCHYRDEIFFNYFFCSNIWKEDIHDWHSLKPSIISIFYKAAKDMGGIPSIIFCMGKFFSGLGSKYIDDGLNCVYEATLNAPLMESENLSDVAIFYRERFMNQYRIQRSRKIRDDRNTKKKVVSILNFMISHGSAKAFRLRDLL